MLSLEPDALAEEINRAEDFRKKHTQRIQAIASRFMGNWFRVDYVSDPTPENTVFAYIAYMLPELWYANPSCRIRAKKPNSHQQIADAMEQAVRTWQSETDFTDEGQDCVRDMIMGYGVMQVGLEPRDFPGEALQQQAPTGGEATEPQQALRPFAVRLPADQLIMDPRCESPLKARYLGHSYWMDLDQLVAAPEKWDPEAVAKLTEVSEDTDSRNERAVTLGKAPDRHRVNLVDLWIPEHGKLITLARDYQATNQVIRNVSYWGPPEGPYEVFGFYRVPGDPYPMGSLQPIMEQLEEMWAHQNQASEEAKSYKRFVLIEAANIEGQKAVLDARSGDACLVRGLAGNFVEVEMGGSPSGRLEHIMTLRDRADRTVGLSDAQRGRVQGKTATETDIVQGNVDTRTSFMRQRVQRHTQRVLRRVCWYMFFDPSIVMPVSSTDPTTGQVTESTFLGGIQEGQEGIDWVDFFLDIEPNSMQHSDDAMIQSRAMETMQMMGNMAQMIPAAPWINWRYIINMFGESFNQKDLAELLINPAALQQFNQSPMAFGQNPQPMLPPGANPALIAQGLGQQGGPGPQWGPNPSMGSGGGMPGIGNAPFAPRSGQIAPPMGAPSAGIATMGGGPIGSPPQAGTMGNGISGVRPFPAGPRSATPAPPFMFIGKGGGNTGGPRQQQGAPHKPMSAKPIAGGHRQQSGTSNPAMSSKPISGGNRQQSGPSSRTMSAKPITGGNSKKQVHGTARPSGVGSLPAGPRTKK